MDTRMIVTLIIYLLAVNCEILIFCLVGAECPLSNDPYEGDEDFHILRDIFGYFTLGVLVFAAVIRLFGWTFLYTCSKFLYWFVNLLDES